jgi:hypothetical protein
MSTAAATKTSPNTQVQEVQQDNDDPKEENDVTKEIRPDHLWAMPLSVQLNLRLHLIYTNSFHFYSQYPAVMHMSRVFFRQ